ncbi:MAG: dolichyl-phosphate-mannose-protein mannosyltransferase family protein [uncultured bacterium]|nr:MAG: dolichyl-phosphate-mannose-protein mannosyltransferase family protein [uncultured bacterium]
MVLGMLLFGENSFGWRVGSAIAGIISIYGLYLLVLRLTSNHRLALLSAFLVSIEGLHIAQSRVAMNDTYMLCFYIWALYAAVKSRWKNAAILYGLALGSKWSAIYGVIPLAFLYLHSNNHLFSALRYTLIAVFVYILTFTPFIVAGHTWEQWVELHRQMWYYHTHLVATHAYQSTPQEWIFAARPVWYHVKYLGDNVAHIYAQANPLILWLGLVALILQLPKLINFPYAICYTLYAIYTLPWLFSPRIMFFYHYLPSATFLCIILASYLVTLTPRIRNGLMALCVIGLIIVFPTLFGLPMSNNFWTSFFAVFPNWK